jgi:hypothetical protein
MGSLRPFCCAVCALALLWGCARDPRDTRSRFSLAGDFGAPFQVQVDNFVRRQEPMVQVHPMQDASHRPTALFVPLRTLQQISDPVSFSDMVSRQFWQSWLEQGAFATLEYWPDGGPFDQRRSLEAARRKGAELLVGGYVRQYIDGGSGGDSSMSLSIEIYDVGSGTMIWSLAQAGMMEGRQVHDFHLFTLRERNPVDPTGLIIRTLARDMGELVAAWVDPTVKDGSRRRGWPKAF